MFDSAKLKVERANQHIDDLETEFLEYVASKPHRFRIYHDPKSGKPKIRIQFVNHPPQSLTLIIGDAIHNIRTALDHMTWEVIGLDCGKQHRNLMLPSGDSQCAFESSCKGIETPSNGVIDLFVSLEIFPGGSGHAIYTIKQLDNLDKHSMLVPIVRATSHPPYTIFGPDGTVHLRAEGNIFASGARDFIDLMNIPPGNSLELDDKADCAPIIIFDNTQGPAGPIIPTLKQFAQLAFGVIQTFESHFTP